MLKCCFIHPQPQGYIGGGIQCTHDAEWEMKASNAVHETVQACTDHVGALLDDAPTTTVWAITK